jgi:hypothetical protein
MSVFCQAVIYLLLAVPAVAQSQAFATITIMPARSPDARNTRMQVLPNGDLIASAVPVVTFRRKNRVLDRPLSAFRFAGSADPLFFALFQPSAA